MPRATCQEDFYEYRVKQIFKRLRAKHASEESAVPFSDWLNSTDQDRDIAKAFMDDVESYMGIEEAMEP